MVVDSFWVRLYYRVSDKAAISRVEPGANCGIGAELRAEHNYVKRPMVGPGICWKSSSTVRISSRVSGLGLQSNGKVISFQELIS
jgi:hypothetical protein